MKVQIVEPGLAPTDTPKLESRGAVNENWASSFQVRQRLNEGIRKLPVTRCLSGIWLPDYKVGLRKPFAFSAGVSATHWNIFILETMFVSY